MAGFKEFSELKGLRDKLQEDERLRALEQAERERRERLARERAAEFGAAVADVVRIKESDRYVWRPLQDAALRGAPIPTRPRTPEEETAAVLAESMLSDGFDVDGLLDEDTNLSWAAPGVGPDVVKKLRKRRWPVDDELDLHGLTRDMARRLFDNFLRRALRRGERCVRVVHGIGYGSAGGEPVLRGMVHSWLVQTPDVVAFCAAGRADGGAGALLVLLKPALNEER